MARSSSVSLRGSESFAITTMASRALTLVAALLLTGLSAAAPTISFPINSQVPPVARIGQPFSFVFSPTTFSSASRVTYSLSNPPRWLSVDSDARRLSGTPREDDIVQGRVAGVPVNLVATDESGSTTLAATLVVSRSPGPKVEIPLKKQVPDFGTFSNPSSILSAPGTSFSFDLDPDTFSDPSGAPVAYYATMADNTPLPAWMSFDPSKLSFTGRTPPSESLIQPPQHFSMQLVASDVVGFAGALLGFDIVVGNHRFVADETTIVLNATPGTPVSYTGLRSNVKVEGKPATIQNANIAAMSNFPPWLSVDNGTWHIFGVPPENAESTNFTITLQDTFSDTLNLTIAVAVTGDKDGLFTGNLPAFTITVGKSFSINLGQYLSNPQDTDISVETDASNPWIKFDPRTVTLSGDAPGDLKASSIDVKVKAKRRDSKKSASLPLSIVIRAVSDGEGTRGTSDSATTSHPTKSPNGQPSLAGDAAGNGHFNTVLLAVLLPLLVLLVLAICVLFWYFRRQKARQRPTITSRDISDPLPGTLVTELGGTGGSHSLPDLSRCFGKSFSADDVFGSDQKTYAESRTAFLTKPGLSQHLGSVKLLPRSSSSCTVARGPGRTSVVGGTAGSLGLRPETQNKLSNSLSSITETSMNDEAGKLVDERALELVGIDGRMSFRDKIEINIPRLQQSPGSMYTGATSPRHCDTEMMSTPQADCSPLPALDTEIAPLKAEPRLSHYPPAASTTRKPSWPWLRGTKPKQQGPKLGRGMKRFNGQPSMSTVNSFGSGKTGLSAVETREENGYHGTAHELPSPALTKVFSQVFLSRPTTRSGRTTIGNMEHQSHGRIETSHTDLTSPGPSLGTARGYSATRQELMDISYQDLAEQSPFRPSRTWSTVQTTDDWVDQTVESLDALQGPATISRPVSQQNWAVLQEPPILTDGDVAGSGRLPEFASSVRLPQIQERELGTAASLVSSRPGTANAGRSGLTRQSHSKGFSLRSEGSKSDYAAFI